MQYNIINAIKEQVATIKENSTSNLIKYNILNLIIKEVNENQRIKSAKLSQKKVTYQNHRRLCVKQYSREKYEQGWKHQSENLEIPGTSSIDIDIISSLQKAPEQIKIPTGTNDTSNDTNYLENPKKIVKCKDTKLSFSSVICRNDIKHIIFTIIITNYHLENYCKQ